MSQVLALAEFRSADEFDRLKVLEMSLGQFTNQDGNSRRLDKDKPEEMELVGSDFIFQNETLLRLPYDSYERYKLGESAHLADFNDRRYKNDTAGFPANPEIWEAVVAVPVFENRELVELALHPITLGYGLPRQVRGRPMLANDELGAKIINDLRERSTPFGTRIIERGGIGYVDFEGN